MVDVSLAKLKASSSFKEQTKSEKRRAEKFERFSVEYLD
jgi:hypothetical protein